MKWHASKPISARCAHALAWCRTFVGQFDAKRLKRAVDIVHYAHHAKE